MSSASHRTGAAFEREVVAYLKAHGFPYAERAYGAGRPDDVGDIDGIPFTVIECKAHRAIDLAGFVDEAVREAHAGLSEQSLADFGARRPLVVAKRRQRDVGHAYVVEELASWCLYNRDGA